MIRLVLLLWFAFSLPLLAQNQDPAVLVADDIRITRDRVLIASGNVEAYHGQTRLSASEISYDQATGQLSIRGPIVIEEGEGTIILANAAELSSDLQNGLLTGARLVLDQQLQLAAIEIARVDGRYTQLYKTAVTSCQICEGDPRPPLWQIRARRVIHDTQEKQMYFDEAQLRIRNLPVFYVPRLRLPDPTLDRATGFLIPQIRSTSQLGTGLKLPYFIKLGDHRDLTLTPFITSNTRTLEFRYRQAFVRGRIEFNGAITRDDLRPGETRGYLFGNGQFDLDNDFKLAFTLETTSDDAYLKEYDFSDDDRLRSEIKIDRARRDEYIAFSYTNFRTLREGEDNATLPTNVLNATWERRYRPAAIGGEFRVAAVAQTHIRTSTLDVDGPDPDGVVDGRDILRLNVDASWRRSWIVRGLDTQLLLGVSADSFRIAEDATFPTGDTRLMPQAALTFRYPMVKRTAKATQFLEPLVQLAWSEDKDFNVPNEESTRVEFDEGNLLALSRFPAPDRRESGLRGAVGISWARFDPDGWQARLTFGQVFRETADASFTGTSGLTGVSSDFLLAGQLKMQNGLAVTARAVFETDFDFSKAEIRTDWSNKRLNIGGSYIYLDADAAEDRLDPISELTLDGTVRLSPDWTASANLRYDLEDNRAATTGIGFAYENECVLVAFTVDRRFTSSASVEPQTSLGLTVSLRGFSTSPGTEKHMRACGKQAL